MPRFGDWPLRELSRGAVVDFLLEVQAQPVVRDRKTLRGAHARSTVRGILATISRLGSVAVLSGIVPVNPYLGLGKDSGSR